jgi:SAM-dependent methyltransferase
MITRQPLAGVGRRLRRRCEENPSFASTAHYFFNGLGADSRRNHCPALIRAAVELEYLRWPLRLRRLVRGRDVLDVGCGRGLHAVGFVLVGARSYTGLDPIIRLDSDKVKNLRTRTKVTCGWSPRQIMARLPRVRLIPGTTGDLAPDAAFDVAVLHNVTEHLIHIGDVFDAIRRHLRPAGRIIFNHHNFYCWNGHHQKPYTVAEIDAQDAEQRKYVDWAHLSYEPRPDEYVARGLNRIRLDDLRALTERHFAVETWQELASDSKRGGGRLTADILRRHPQYTERELSIHNVYCLARRRDDARPRRRKLEMSSAPCSAVALTALAAALAACTAPNRPPEPQPHELAIRSLLGRTLEPPPIPAERRAALEADLAAAVRAYNAGPADEQNIIWVGRRMAYLGRYREAIGWFTVGLAVHPRSSRLLRHRGHRQITVRDFRSAVRDLTRAAALIEGVPDEMEPDGQPNARGIPRSSSHTNIYYHLGLARYLRGEFDRALDAYRRCADLCTNDDMLVATLHWTYMTLRRLGRDAEAAALLERVSPGMDIMENTAYHRLLLMYKGDLSTQDILAGVTPGETSAIDDATTAYGVATWLWCNGDHDEARALLERIVEGEAWAAFGFIAAEADLARLRAGS